MLHMSENNLSALLVKAQEGDAPAYNLFLQECSIFLRPRLKRWIHRPEVIEELTQEILIGIHRNLHTYLPGRDAKAWIMGICRFKVIDYLRKNPHKFEELTKDVTNHHEFTNNELEDLEEILNDLPTLIKEALFMTKVQGQSTKEAALNLGIKENALRTRVSRALSRLKKDLKI